MSAAVGAEPQAVVELGLWWPAADPGDLRAMADAWDDVADDLDGARRASVGLAGEVSSTNAGAAIDAFDACVGTWTGGHLPEAAEHARGMAERLRSYAEAVDETRGELVRMAAEIAASIAIGVGLAFFTAGVSAGVAATVTASMVARAGVLASSLAGRALAIGARVVVYGGVGGFEAGATNLVIQTGRSVVVHDNRNPFDGYDLRELVLASTGGAVLGGATAGFRSLTQVRGAPSTMASLRTAMAPLRRGRSARVRLVRDEVAFNRFYLDHVHGGRTIVRETDRTMVELVDGTTVNMRRSSTSGGPTIDIASQGARIMKIHIG